MRDDVCSRIRLTLDTRVEIKVLLSTTVAGAMIRGVDFRFIGSVHGFHLIGSGYGPGFPGY